MCNGWNHHEDCACGFGPPYPGTITPLEEVSWWIGAARSKDRFVRTLRALGLSSEAIEEETKRYADGVESVLATGKPIEFVRNWFRDFLSRRRLEVVESKMIEIQVPLFKLHSPAVHGSRVTYQESDASVTGRGWTVTILGAGTGSDRKFEVQYTATFRSENGGYELVFAPVPVRVDRVRVYERGDVCGEGIRSAVELSSKAHLNKALKTLTARDLRRDSELTDPDEERFQLGRSTSNSATYTWRWAELTAFRLQLGAQVFGMQAVIPADVQRAHELVLTFELPCGHDYGMRRLRDEHGFVWRVDHEQPRMRSDNVTSVRTH